MGLIEFQKLAVGNVQVDRDGSGIQEAVKDRESYLNAGVIEANWILNSSSDRRQRRWKVVANAFSGAVLRIPRCLPRLARRKIC